MSTQKQKATLGASLIVISSVFYASYGIWTKLMGDAFGGYMAAGIRSILVLLILLGIAFLFKKLEPLRLRRTWPYLVGMFVSALGVWGPLYYAILHGGVGIGLTVSYACIVIGMFIFGWLFAKERFGKDKFIAATLGIVGLILIYLPSMSAGISLLALGAAAISGFMTAFNMTLVKQIPQGATQSIILGWAAGSIANLIMAYILHETAPALAWNTKWLALAAFVVVSVVASWSFTVGLKMIDAGIAGILGLLEIVFAVLFGVLFFDEHPNGVVLLGVIAIIISAAVPYATAWRLYRRAKRLGRLKLASKRA